MEHQLEPLSQQALQHHHQHSIVIDRLIGLGRDRKAVRFQPVRAAGDLLRPNTIGAHDAALQRDVIRVEPTVPGIDSGRAWIGVARLHRSHFKLPGNRRLPVNRPGDAYRQTSNGSNHGQSFSRLDDVKAENVDSGLAYKTPGVVRLTGMLSLQLEALCYE